MASLRKAPLSARPPARRSNQSRQEPALSVKPRSFFFLLRKSSPSNTKTRGRLSSRPRPRPRLTQDKDSLPRIVFAPPRFLGLWRLLVPFLAGVDLQLRARGSAEPGEHGAQVVAPGRGLRQRLLLPGPSTGHRRGAPPVLDDAVRHRQVHLAERLPQTVLVASALQDSSRVWSQVDQAIGGLVPHLLVHEGKDLPGNKFRKQDTAFLFAGALRERARKLWFFSAARSRRLSSHQTRTACPGLGCARSPGTPVLKQHAMAGTPGQ